MKITLFCFGKLKEAFWKDACADYLKRLQPYAKTEIVEFPDEPIEDSPTPAEIEKVKAKEGEKVLDKLPSGAFLIAFDGGGKTMDSVAFSSFLETSFVRGASHVYFVIGGSLGLSCEVKKRADYLLSFGPMTFPHNLARVMALEQLYRAFKIARHEPYHK